MQGETNDEFMKMVNEGRVDPTAGPLEQPPAGDASAPPPEEPGAEDWNDPNFVDNKTFRGLPEEAKKALGNRLAEVREERGRNQELMGQLAQSQAQLASAMERIAGGQEAAAEAVKPKYDDDLGKRSSEDIATWVGAEESKAFAALASDDAEQRTLAAQSLLRISKAKEILGARRMQDVVAAQTAPLRDEIAQTREAAQQRTADDARWLDAFGQEALNNPVLKKQAAEMFNEMAQRGAFNPNNPEAVEAASFAAMMAVTQAGAQQKPPESIQTRERLDLGGGPGNMGNTPRNAIDAAMKRGDVDAAIHASLEAELQALL